MSTMTELPRLSRRDWLKLSAAGVVASSVSGWLENLADAAAAHPLRKRSCILLWMNGGPSQMDTFDLKPGHRNGGPFKEIATSAPGLKICEHLPKLARFGNKMAVVRSLSTKEGDHGRASYLLRTGYLPQGAIHHPTLGSLLAKELGRDGSPLPNFVSIAPYRQFNAAAYGPGFLGPMHAPLIIGENTGAAVPAYDEALKVQDLKPAGAVSGASLDARLGLLRDLERDFSTERPDAPPRSHKAAYDRAVRLMKTAASRAFNLTEEPAAVRDAYGRNLFGQGCLLARRLVERGVPFVEVTLGGVNGGAFGWDTHGNNFPAVKSLCEVLDPAWASLMKDLQERGLLDTTLIVWMGEFGRTPVINASQGRDHYPNAWSAVLAGGGIKGGQAYGRTSADGMTVEDKLTTVPDFLATACVALGIDPEKQNPTSNGRPIRIVDKTARPIRDIAG
jgi:uncharacterized protein (DUF1501 family)